MNNRNPMRRRKPAEEGYILIAVIFMLAILMIALAVAAPVVKKDIQRDREIETMRRGKQYVRAVKLYYKKFGAYPPSVDALVNTNEIRFLRKKYIDPTTGKEEWKIIRFGQNKTQTLGFFGQPIGGTGMAAAGIGPAGGSGSAGGSSGPGIGSPFGGGSAFGGPNSPAGGGSASGSTDSGTGATPPSGGSSTSATGGSTDASSNSGSTDPNAPGGSSGGGSSGGLTGQTFGGAGIIGVSPNSPKQSILVYKKKNHYNEWEFFYDPIADQMIMQGGNTGMIGQPASGMSGSSTNGGNSGFGGSIPGASPSGGSPTPPSPPQPQQ
jgi:type II secretory pathway pseudopilin PulG